MVTVWEGLASLQFEPDGALLPGNQNYCSQQKNGQNGSGAYNLHVSSRPLPPLAPHRVPVYGLLAQTPIPPPPDAATAQSPRCGIRLRALNGYRSGDHD